MHGHHEDVDCLPQNQTCSRRAGWPIAFRISCTSDACFHHFSRARCACTAYHVLKWVEHLGDGLTECIM